MSDNRSDEEIAAEERRRRRLLGRAVVGTFLFWLVAALLLVLFFNSGIPQHLAAQTGISDGILAWSPLVLLVGLWLLALRRLKKFSPSPASLRPGVQRRLVDEVTRRQRNILAGLIPLTLFLANTQRNQPDAGDQWFYAGLFLAVMLMVGLSVVLGPGFLSRQYRAANGDEMSRALRRRATAIGYITAIAAMGIDYLLYLFVPGAVGRALPFSMAAVFVIPAAYFVWADWRSEREG